MDKEKLKKLAENPQFIEGIYNYCDRWCERCPFTSRCLNFALGQEEFDELEAQDLDNEAFWQKLTESFQVTLELLHEAAEREGIDLDSIDIESFSEQEELKDELTKNHECCRAARLYGEMVDDWFDSARELFHSDSDESSPTGELDTPKVSPLGEDDSLAESVEVILWYQHQIYVKLMRAVRGDLEERPEILDEYPKDSDGSAKVALIGIDRSIAAWGEVRNYIPLGDDGILDILVNLERLRRKVEHAFPDARAFIRPGFDKIVLNS